MNPESDTRSGAPYILDELLRAADTLGLTDVEEILFDPVTHLPTLQMLLKEIQSTLSDRDQVGLLTLVVNPFVKLEDLFGWELYDAVIRAVAESLQAVKRECLRESDYIAELSVSGDSFVLVLSPPRYRRFLQYEELDRLRNRVSEGLRRKLSEKFTIELVSQFGCFIGCAIVHRENGARTGRLVSRALTRAYSDAFQERERELHERRSDLRRLIDEDRLTAVYQPIVDLEARKVFGYEAFTRGPRREYKTAEYLFEIAHRTQMVWELDRACRRKALLRAADLPEGCSLFLNIEPDSLFDPDLGGTPGLDHLAKRVVLEITERAMHTDFALFRRALELVRRMGLRVAIDDVGSGYSGLRRIAEVRPSFIKLDMHIIRDLQDDSIKRDVVRLVAGFAVNTGISAIAEGVEKREELDCLRRLGIRYAQGFLFGRPTTDFADANLP